jgi:hypothetical protein
MVGSEDRPYWVRADDIAYSIYRQLFNLIVARGKVITSVTLNNDLTFNFEDIDSQITIDLLYYLDSSPKIKEADNIAACLADEDYSEIEIHTIVPKGMHIKKLKKNKKFQWDLLNVIRHELEHVIQGCSLSIKTKQLPFYERSKSNFLLLPCEIPAYVHGFRISTISRSHFLNSITDFVNIHGKNLKLCKQEIDFTIKTWYDYLKNLNYHSKIQYYGGINE